MRSAPGARHGLDAVGRPSQLDRKSLIPVDLRIQRAEFLAARGVQVCDVGDSSQEMGGETFVPGVVLVKFPRDGR